MCFSATASFSAGAFLIGISAFTIRAARAPAEVPFAAIPLLFGLQQLCEGAIWLGFSHDAPLIKPLLTHLYSFFSHVLWPVYIPVAVLLLEPPGPSRRRLRWLVAIGSGVALYLLIVIASYPIIAQPVGKHIEYISPHFLAPVTMAWYLVAVTISPMMSSHRPVVIFGVMALLSFAGAWVFYMNWFISVWCLFMAVLSGIILFHFRPHARLAHAARYQKQGPRG